MASYLQDKMRSGYERYLDEQKLEWEGGLLKTYLVEADIVEKPTDSHNEQSGIFARQLRLPFFLEEDEDS